MHGAGSVCGAGNAPKLIERLSSARSISTDCTGWHALPRRAAQLVNSFEQRLARELIRGEASSTFLSTWDVGQRITSLDLDLARRLDGVYDTLKANRLAERGPV
jgi:hypothetical protein